MSWGTVWLAMTIAAGGWLAAFGVFEGVALAERRTDRTYSVWIRRALGITPPRWYRRLAATTFAAVLIGFVAWFVPHITGG